MAGIFLVYVPDVVLFEIFFVAFVNETSYPCKCEPLYQRHIRLRINFLYLNMNFIYLYILKKFKFFKFYRVEFFIRRIVDETRSKNDKFQHERRYVDGNFLSAF